MKVSDCRDKVRVHRVSMISYLESSEGQFSVSELELIAIERHALRPALLKKRLNVALVLREIRVGNNDVIHHVESVQ